MFNQTDTKTFSSFVPYAQRLRDLADRQPDLPALIVDTVSGREIYSYAQFNAKVDVFAVALKQEGVDKNTAVIIVSPNSSAAVLASAAAWRLGAFVVPVSAKSTQSDLEASITIVSQTGRKVSVLSDTILPLPGAHHCSLEALHQLQSDTAVEANNPTPAWAIPSGGTTGKSKLIVGNAPWGHGGESSIMTAAGWDVAERVLVYGPLYHTVGLLHTHCALMDGKTVVLMDRFDAARVQTIIEQDRIEFFFAIPILLQRLLEFEGVRADAYDSIKTMYHSGASCSPSLKARWLDFLGPERVWEIYGATEGIGFTTIRGDHWLKHPGSVGKPFRSEIKILDEQYGPLPPGEIGLIFMKRSDKPQDQPSFAYLGADMPEPTDDGFQTVGDMGWLDEQGYLHIADRRTDMIISGGVNIFPAEVEATLCRYDGVREAAVIGIPDKQWGRRLHALIVPLDPNNPPLVEFLDAFMNQEMVAYKKPKSYEIREALVFTDVGKLDRRVLTEQCSVSTETSL